VRDSVIGVNLLFRRLVGALITLAAVVSALSVGVPSATAARPKVLLIGDSTLAALVWYPQSKQQLAGLDYDLQAESCRAVTAQSCVGRRNASGVRIRPTNAMTVLRSYPKDTFNELVLMVGYDEGYATFKKSVVELPQAARELGIDHITWLTFRTDVDYAAPNNTVTSYHGNNRLIEAAAASSGGFITLLDWNTYARNNPSTVERDGVHLTSKGAHAVASLIKGAVIKHWGNDAATPSSPPPASNGGRPVLSYGTISESVKEAQRLLIAVGSPELAKFGVTGRYFKVTKTAVEQFQKLVRDKHDSSMVIDGVVGATTWKWLDKLAANPAPAPAAPAPAPPPAAPATGDTIGYGATGPAVTEIQQILLRIGSPLLEPYGATGRYFAATRDAVRYFQQTVKLKHDSAMVIDGTVGPSTMRWLRQLDPG
jgi:peptidoglycan hydrolase-like protein with peptidoglycan-binding domain